MFLRITLAALLFLISCSENDQDTIDNTSGSGNNPNSYPINQSVGFSANDILSGNNYNVISIDLMYVDGFKPEQSTLNNLTQFLLEHTFKTNINIIPRLIPNTGIENYSLNDVRNLEDQHRNEFTEGNTIAISALFLNGASASNQGNSTVLGTAYRNTSFVVFEETIQSLSDSPLEPSRVTVESTVLLHELCHLLGLVNVGSDMVEDHQDVDHGAHCNVNSCLMYFAIENGNSISGMLSGGSVPELDPFCVQDLQANGGR